MNHKIHTIFSSNKIFFWIGASEEIGKEARALGGTKTLMVTSINEKRMERFWKVVSLLQENSRMSLCEMSKTLKIPVSTLFDMIKEVEKTFKFTIVLKDKERKV